MGQGTARPAHPASGYLSAAPARISSASGFQPALARDTGSRAALGAVGLVEVFELGARVGAEKPLAQLGRELALLLDRGEDRGAALFERAQTLPLGVDLAQLLFVQPAGALLAVARDERDRVARVQQLDRRRHVGQAQPELPGDACGQINR